jgi:hypothetical protein
MISSVTGRTHVVDDRADGDFEYQPHQRASARADGLLPDSDSFTMPSPQFAYFSFLKRRNLQKSMKKVGADSAILFRKLPVRITHP